MIHHHDWWFENRWHHFAKRSSGFRTIRAMAMAVFSVSHNICHAAINQTDARILEKHLPGRAGWLPNPVEPMRQPPATRVKAARAWLRERLEDAAPVWLLPCRLLRRKNIAEALLITRWLRPEAWLATTGGVSSAEEQFYADSLATAAKTHGWRLCLGLLNGDESSKPSVSELLAASEAVVLTSIQEGFGIPYLEASAMNQPLVARELPNVAPDLAIFGFKFPQLYKELFVDPSLFDWPREHKRQAHLFSSWKQMMPRSVSALVGMPFVLNAGAGACPVPFSRLTLTAQLEVLAHAPEQSLVLCEPLNPFLKTWRKRAANRQLEAIAWPQKSAKWLSGSVFVDRFSDILSVYGSRMPPDNASQKIQEEFLRMKLRAENLYPLLWSSRT